MKPLRMTALVFALVTLAGVSRRADQSTSRPSRSGAPR